MHSGWPNYDMRLKKYQNAENKSVNGICKYASISFRSVTYSFKKWFDVVHVEHEVVVNQGLISSTIYVQLLRS